MPSRTSNDIETAIERLCYLSKRVTPAPSTGSERLQGNARWMDLPVDRIKRMAVENADEWKFVLLGTFGLLLVTSLPYAVAYLTAPHDRVFMGVLLDVPDHEQYFSWMRDLSRSWLATNRLTPEPNRAVFFNLLWLMLGRVGAWFGLGIAPVYQLLRFSSAFAFFASLAVVLRRFVPSWRARRLVLVLVAVGSGFGWVLVLLKYTLTQGQLLFPLDVFIAEGNSFLDVMAYPHFVAAAVYILAFELILRAWERESAAHAWGAGALALFLGLQHAYDLILVYGVLGAYTLARLVRDKELPRFAVASLAIVVAVSVWPAVYSVLLTRMDPIWSGVLGQFANAGVFSPSLPHLVIVMGFPFLLALAQLITDLSRGLSGFSTNELFVRVWFVANVLLLYIPTDYQVHMLNGLQVPVAILAVEFTFESIVPRVRGWWIRVRPDAVRLGAGTVMASALVLMVVPTNIYLWTWRFVDLARAEYPYFLHVEDLEALEWLNQYADGSDVVLSSLTLGQFVPAYTDARSFLGHWAQTLDFYEKRDMVDSFFSSETQNRWRVDLLMRYSVDYVLVGDAERSLGDFNPASVSYLRPVYRQGEMTIYRFISPDATLRPSEVGMP